MLASTNINQSAELDQNLHEPKILDEFDYGSKWTQTT